MRICIDARVVGTRPHGIARYVINLVRELVKVGGRHEYLVLASSPGGARVLWAVGCRRIRTIGMPVYSVREQVVLPILLRRQTDLFHAPTFAAPVLQPWPTVMTIHDAIHLILAEKYTVMHRLYYRWVVASAAGRAQKVITVSQTSRSDLIKHLNLAPERIVVIPNGVDPVFRQLPRRVEVRERVKARWGIGGAFLLWVGSTRPSKNLPGIAELFRRLADEDVWLVVVGVGREQARRIIADSSWLKNVVFVQDVADDDLVELYNGAEVVILTSLYEGFGLPGLEAMACGTPVVSSNKGSLPEVLGDAALSVDPCDTQGMADAVRRVLRDFGLREEMRRRGLERARAFRWEDTARRTLSVYEEVCQGRKC